MPAVLVLLLALLTTQAASAVTGLSARGVHDLGPVPRTHGWLILDHPAEGADAALVHLPPRGGGGAEPGSARRARVLARTPDAIAARGDTVVVIQHPAETDDPGPPVRRLGELRAVPTPVQGVWAFDPADRLRPVAPLIVEGDVRGAAFDGETLVVLLADAEGTHRLARLDGNEWTLEPLSVTGDARLLADAGRAVIVTLDADALAVRAIDGASFGRLDAAPAGRLPDLFAGGDLLWVLDARVVSWRPGAESTHAIALADAPRGPVAAVALGVRGGRLALLTDPAPEGPSSHLIAEYALSTGRTLYAGPVLRTLPVSPAEFRLLAAFLVALTVGTLLVALRPAGDPGVCALPDGWALAEPVRRISATLIDLVLAVGLVGYASDGGRPLTIIALVVDPTAWLAIPAVLSVASSMTIACELVFGRSIGKVVCGCRVVRCGATLDRPGFGPVVARNLIKWFLSPLTVLSLIDGSGGRHRGDTLAGTVVVTRAAEPAVDDRPSDRG